MHGSCQKVLEDELQSESVLHTPHIVPGRHTEPPIVDGNGIKIGLHAPLISHIVPVGHAGPPMQEDVEGAGFDLWHHCELFTQVPVPPDA